MEHSNTHKYRLMTRANTRVHPDYRFCKSFNQIIAQLFLGTISLGILNYPLQSWGISSKSFSSANSMTHSPIFSLYPQTAYKHSPYHLPHILSHQHTMIVIQNLPNLDKLRTSQRGTSYVVTFNKHGLKDTSNLHWQF